MDFARVSWAVAQTSIRERLVHDLGFLKDPIARTVFTLGNLLQGSPSLRQRSGGLQLIMRLHSGAFSDQVDRRIAGVIREAMSQRNDRSLTALYDRTISNATDAFYRSNNPDPSRLIGSRILVIKSHRPGERGVLLVDYSYVFPLMAGLFDLETIADRYALVLEPSWAGACAPEILLYQRVSTPVFVETIEPRDRDFLAALQTNIDVAPIGANWWVDHRSSRPSSVSRDIDVVMLASWSDIKRHWRFFKVIGQLRRRGHRLKVVLIGYPYDRTRSDIVAQARYFGVADQVEVLEWLSKDEIAGWLSRSKVHVLWSRRECSNRAIIEAMLCDVPVIVRKGLTFGFEYPYINEHTGRFVPEEGLADALLDMIENHKTYSPRDWVLNNMTCQHATLILERRLRQRAELAGEPWTRGLVVRTSTLTTQEYWNVEDRTKFSDDYRFLESTRVR